MKLSDNFELDEFLVSQTAVRAGIDMTPTPEIIANIATLAENYLQPIRETAGAPIIISSGFRPPVLNDLIGGSKTSAHRFGRATDFRVIGQTPYQTCEMILQMDLDFDQLINEFGAWVHLGIAELPRVEVLTARRENGSTRYVRGLEEV